MIGYSNLSIAHLPLPRVSTPKFSIAHDQAKISISQRLAKSQILDRKLLFELSDGPVERSERLKKIYPLIRYASQKRGGAEKGKIFTDGRCGGLPDMASIAVTESLSDGVVVEVPTTGIWGGIVAENGVRKRGYSDRFRWEGLGRCLDGLHATVAPCDTFFSRFTLSCACSAPQVRLYETKSEPMRDLRKKPR